MRFYVFRNWLLKQLNLSKRLQRIVLWYLISLIIITRKHSLEHAAAISGKNKSQFSRLLKKHSARAVSVFTDLSKREAKKWSEAVKALRGLPWKVALIVDLTDQGRASLHPQNAKKLNHGRGYYIGHQWTNVVLLVGDHLVPLPPIAFYSRKYCRKLKIEYKTEHDRVIDYLAALDLRDYLHDYRPQDIVVLADAGYDDKRIQKAILKKGWDFVMALKKIRAVKSNAAHLATHASEGWRQIEVFFKAYRRLKWQTVRFLTNGSKRRRKEFRIRHIIGWLRSVGPVQLVCSERKKSPGSERKYLACSQLTVKPRQILAAYALRWKVELFHKAIKMHLGFEDISTVSFNAVIAHVHWVYCGYLLLNGQLPGVQGRTLAERQQHIMQILDHKEKAHLLQKLTRINGLADRKNELKEALAA